MRLQGKTALITGAGEGIGGGIARRFAEEGAAVVIAEYSEATGRANAEAIKAAGGRALFVRTDVNDKAQLLAAVEAATREYGGADILVNNAYGGGHIRRLEDKTDEEFDHSLTMSVKASFWAMRACFPHMKAAGWGRIVSICSLNGVNAHVYSADFNAGKEGLRALTRTAAREWAPFGITANVICPGAASAAYLRFKADHPENAAAMDKMNPMGRTGDVDSDIAPVALFLASDDSRYVTGNTLFADGGGHINGVAWTPEPEAIG
ncbi:SDR family NAD(P)-dependent oxidoreductase [Sphingomonas jatrophae]|uniref:NAD(P)-dependent dehydrogenase, short-chain alcohol dehydrogenase family n=1 Tax=Sphingomonas jatrophae TaxID=1166337 RepID=A0A1I6KBH3_9SPHN|nr:SDR family oxidoreductase [Sphingomonas jatrophae]SFR88603.1 NAD(P)-dependent dehydrogenase, short-chain alcohol dehydrogenase family [Sphingomonas jatrophae]